MKIEMNDYKTMAVEIVAMFALVGSAVFVYADGTDAAENSVPIGVAIGGEYTYTVEYDTESLIEMETTSTLSNAVGNSGSGFEFVGTTEGDGSFNGTTITIKPASNAAVGDRCSLNIVGSPNELGSVMKDVTQTINLVIVGTNSISMNQGGAINGTVQYGMVAGAGCNYELNDGAPKFLSVNPSGVITTDWSAYETSSNTGTINITMTNTNDSLIVPVDYTVTETQITVKDQDNRTYGVQDSGFKFITYGGVTSKYVDLSVNNAVEGATFSIGVEKDGGTVNNILSVSESRVTAMQNAAAGDYTLNVSYVAGDVTYATVEGIPFTIEQALTINGEAVGEGLTQERTLKAIAAGTNSFTIITNLEVTLNSGMNNVKVGETAATASISFSGTTGTITLTANGAEPMNTPTLVTFTGETEGGQTFSYGVNCQIVKAQNFTSAPSNGATIDAA